MRYVFDFDHAHRRAPMDLKDLLGGKGANLAEMTSVLRLPVPPGFTITTDACRAWLEPARCPRGSSTRWDARGGASSARWASASATPHDPLLVSVRSGAKFSMPGMMDTVLNLGLNDRSVEGLARQTDDRRFALDSYRRFISMYGRIVLGIDGAALRRAVRQGEGRRGHDERRRGARRAARRARRRAQGRRRRGDAGDPFPQDPADQLLGAIEAVFSSWGGDRADRLPRARGDRARPRHGRQRPGDGLRQPRRPLRHRRRLHARPRDREARRLRRLPRQRPGRGRRRGDPAHRAAERHAPPLPEGPRRAARDLRPPRAALPGHVRHRVHDRAGPALDAADPGGQADRARPRCGWRSR